MKGVNFTEPLDCCEKHQGNHVKHQAFLASEMDSNVNQR